MPDIKTDDGCTIHAEVEGPDTAPVLMLSNSLGTDLHMWDAQVAPLTQHFRLVRYDRRGHGKSSVPQGPYSMERLGRDVLGVLDGLGIAKINWCGLSMGGMVGQWLGANAPGRVDKLVLSNTSCYFPDKTDWNDRHQDGARKRLDGDRRRQYGALVHQGFRERAPEAMAKMQDMFAATTLEAISAAATRSATWIIARFAEISAPTLVIAGRHDPATPLEGNEFIRAAHPRRQDRRARSGPYRQYRAAAGLRRHGARIFAELEGATRSQLREPSL